MAARRVATWRSIVVAMMVDFNFQEFTRDAKAFLFYERRRRVMEINSVEKSE